MGYESQESVIDIYIKPMLTCAFANVWIDAYAIILTDWIANWGGASGACPFWFTLTFKWMYASSTIIADGRAVS